MNYYQFAALAGACGYLQESEIQKLVELASGKEVLEVGSFKGLSAFFMAIVAKSVVCVDTFAADGGGQTQGHELTTFKDFRTATSRFNNVAWFIGTSEQAATSPEGPQGQFDMIFIDAMHVYESVKQDIELWWPRVKSGGIIAFHDYGHTLNHDGSVKGGFPGVTRAVDEKFGKPQGIVCSLAWVTKP